MSLVECRENVASNLKRKAQELKFWSKKRTSVVAPLGHFLYITIPFVSTINAADRFGYAPHQWIEIGNLLYYMTLAGEVGHLFGMMTEGRETIQTSSKVGPLLSRDMKLLAKVIQPKK